MAEELRSVLKVINESLKTCGDSLDKLEDLYDSGVPKHLQNVFGDFANDKVSLLSLKNGSMLSYLNSLLLLIGERLNKNNDVEEERLKTIEQRVVLERGVKPLEKKLGYQLDKLTRAYTRMEKDIEESKNRLEMKSLQVTNTAGEAGSDSDSEEEMNYKPNAANMIPRSATKSTSGRSSKTVAADESKLEDNVYRPPKISAVLPPKTSHFEDRFNAQEHKDKSNRSRMQAMEEHLKEGAAQPEWEASIGANIVNHGRGGIKTSRDTEREYEVKQFEEDNFTRLNPNGSKTDKRNKKQRERMAKVNMIGGEDFSIFSSKRKLEDSTSRRGNKKSRNAWERVKRNL